MNARARAINELEKAGYLFKRHGANHDIFFHAEKKRLIPLKRHDFDESDLRYIIKEIKQGEK